MQSGRERLLITRMVPTVERQVKPQMFSLTPQRHLFLLSRPLTPWFEPATPLLVG